MYERMCCFFLHELRKCTLNDQYIVTFKMKDIEKKFVVMYNECDLVWQAGS